MAENTELPKKATAWLGATAIDQYNRLIKKGGYTQTQKLQELDHNIQDNGGTKVKTILYKDQFGGIISFESINIFVTVIN